jgi:hypothetical protein
MTLHLGRPDDEKQPLCGAKDGSTIGYVNAGLLEQYASLDGEYPCYACERVASGAGAAATPKPKKKARRSSKRRSSG